MGKLKRQKWARKYLEFYKLNFGISAPYTLVVDGEYIQEALRHKVHIKEQIPKLFQSTVIPSVTKCTVASLRRRGNRYSGAALIAKRFERTACTHEGGVIAEINCLKALVGSSNEQKVCYGAQDVQLRNHVRTVPAAPLLFLREGVPIFEAPSKATKQVFREKMSKKGDLTEREKKIVGKLVKSDAKEPVRRKRKGPKEPNPLSRKRKKKVKTVNPDPKAKLQNTEVPKEEGNKEQKSVIDEEERMKSEKEKIRRKQRRRRGKKKKTHSAPKVATDERSVTR
uniref:UTP23 sensor motif region domain-containing protein n=1 Tax=Lotharella globosa TaxID=91324 RepID=A0A7S3YYY4_9EUKA|mmetsp:Transcript_12330/g.25085  ORF Transcript_12330/g.25085 Transcript_12330/m.25085 type:complete len:282 (-) Transcript_12330:230-1075(-)